MFDRLISLLDVPVAMAQVAGAGEVASETQDQLTQLVTSVIAKIPLWITAFIVIVLSFIIARIVKGSVENKLAEEGFEEEHKELSIVAGRSANVIVLTVGLTVGLKIAGIDLTTIIAAGAFGIGFALKDLIMNFIAGVMILTARHYSIGDWIKVNGIVGIIQEIQSRATIVKKFDGTKVVIPNSDLFLNSVTSLTSNPFRRFEVIVGVEYGTDLKLALQCCLKAAKDCKRVLESPKPYCLLKEFGDSSINIRVRAWVESKKGVLRATNQVILNIKKEFDAVGIGIPFPIRTIVFDEDAKREKQEQMQMMEEQKMEEQQEQPNELVPAMATVPVAAVPVSDVPPTASPSQESAAAPDWVKNEAAKLDQSAIEAPAAQPTSQATAQPETQNQAPPQTVEQASGQTPAPGVIE